MNWRSWRVGIAVAVAVVGAAAADGYFTQGGEHSPSTRPASSSFPLTCSFYKYGSDVRLTIEGTGTESECETLAQELSGGGGYWVYGTPPLVGELHTICALIGPKGSTRAIVEDTGSAFYGTTICGHLSHRGWTVDPNPPAEGPQAAAYSEAQREEEEREAEARLESEREWRRQAAINARRQHREEACDREAEAVERSEDARIKEVDGESIHAGELEVEAGEREIEAMEKCER
jgi:hypothetical protein